MDKFSELKSAAEKYSLTLNAHRESPRDIDAIRAWDEADAELSRVISHKETNIIIALLAELEREQGMRAQNLEIKTLLSEKVKGLETKLWDSQQLVDVKNGSQIELRSQISSLEESNRKDMAWREERLCELEDSLEAAQERISELETKLATPIVAPDDGFDDFKEIRPDSTNDFDTGYNFGLYRYEQNIRAAGFTVEGDEQ